MTPLGDVMEALNVHTWAEGCALIKIPKDAGAIVQRTEYRVCPDPISERHLVRSK
jgi:hypothetical protein